MSMTIEANAKRRASERLARLHNVALAEVEGRPIADDADAEFTVEEIRDEVHRIEQRRPLFAAYQAGDQARRDRDNLTAEITALDAAEQQRRRAYDHDRVFLASQLEQAQAVVLAAKSAERELKRLASPELQAAIANNIAKMSQLAAKKTELERKVSEARRAADANVVHGLRQPGDSHFVLGLLADIQGVDAEIAETTEHGKDLYRRAVTE